jgi:hypothetical protein
MKKETENQNLHNTVVSTLQAENKQYTHNSSLCKPDTIENQNTSGDVLCKKKRFISKFNENQKKHFLSISSIILPIIVKIHQDIPSYNDL